jgi:uncharacterized membrane protein (UPF0182 family)
MKIDQARFIPFEVPVIRIRLIISYLLYNLLFSYILFLMVHFIFSTAKIGELG